MSILVIGEHNNKELKSSTLNSITAASVINDDIHVVVIGNNCEEMANRVATTDKVKKVLLLEDSKYENPIAEKISPVITSLAKDYSHIVSPATTFGKNIMPRVAASLDLSQVSDVIKIENEDTFVRPVYAGNALATVQSNQSLYLFAALTFLHILPDLALSMARGTALMQAMWKALNQIYVL